MKTLIIILLNVTTAFFSYQSASQESIARPAVLVINAVVEQENQSELNGYLSQMMQIFKEHGGKPIGRYKTIEKVEGTGCPEMIALISFKDVSTIKNMLDSENYKSLSDLRERVFDKLNIVICDELN